MKQYNFRLSEESAMHLERIRASRGIASHSAAVRLALRNESRRAGFMPLERRAILEALHDAGLDEDIIRRVTLAID